MKISRALKVCLIGVGLFAVIFHPEATIAIGTYVNNRSPKINSEEAYKIVEQEGTKLAIKSRVAVQISRDDALRKFYRKALCGTNKEGKVIAVNASDLTEFLIRRELYNVSKGWCEARLGSSIDDTVRYTPRLIEMEKMKPFYIHAVDYLDHFYRKEQLATIYALTGLKL